MKFVWFNLMPWPDLPDDFRETNRSVWVDIDSNLFDPERANGLYHEYMDQLEFADEMGFDGIGVNEHHQNGYGIMPSPNLIAAGLARRTSNAAICVIGNSIALYNPPIRVAEEFAMLDCISGGRLVAGFPVGTPMDTNFTYGQIPALTRDKYDEAHELIIRAWAEDEPFAFDGKYNQLRYVNCWPKPIQRPRPPIYIPGGGSIETWDFCLDHDYNYSYLSFNGHKAGQALLDGYWERVAERDKDESPGRASFAQIICVADTDAQAEELYAEHILYFFNRCLHVHPGFADPPGYRTVKTIKAGKLGGLRKENQELFKTLTWKDLVDGGFVIAGSPDTVREQMEQMIKDLRIGTVFGLFHMGDMPDWKTRFSTQLFAEKVMPGLKNIWPELETDGLVTRRGIKGDVLVGGTGRDLVYFHGAGGAIADEPMLNTLAQTHRVHAPIWPGFGTDETETAIEDMLDFALHGWDLIDALNLAQPPLIVGHSMGAMIAAEMASIARTDLQQLVLLAPAGLWIDAEPTPDLFAMLPFEMAEVLFHDPVLGEKLLTGGQDFGDNDALTAFMVANARRMGTAGKILFPIPNRRLSKRMQRIGVPTLIVGGASDGLVPANYLQLWTQSIVGSELVTIAEAGHMLHLEQPDAVASAIAIFARQ